VNADRYSKKDGQDAEVLPQLASRPNLGEGVALTGLWRQTGNVFLDGSRSPGTMNGR